MFELKINRSNEDYFRSDTYLFFLNSLGETAKDYAEKIYASCDNPSKEMFIVIDDGEITYSWVNSQGFNVSHNITKTTNIVKYFL